MSEQLLSLTGISVGLAPLPEGVDAATALIAVMPPHTLDLTVSATKQRASELQRDADVNGPAQAEMKFERTIEYSDSPEAISVAGGVLRKLSAFQQNSEFRYMELYPDQELALKVDARRSKLTKPVRWLAAIGLATTIGGGVTYMMYENALSTNRTVIADTKLANEKSSPAYRVPVPKETLDSDQVVSVSGLGLLGVAVGAVGGNIMTSALSNDIAHARAKRIVRKARAS